MVETKRVESCNTLYSLIKQGHSVVIYTENLFRLCAPYVVETTDAELYNTLSSRIKHLRFNDHLYRAGTELLFIRTTRLYSKLSRFLAKTLRENKIVMKSFSKNLSLEIKLKL